MAHSSLYGDTMIRTKKPNFHLAIWRLWREASLACGQTPESWNDYQHRTRRPRTAAGREQQRKQLERIYTCIAKGASCSNTPFVNVLPSIKL